MDILTLNVSANRLLSPAQLNASRIDRSVLESLSNSMPMWTVARNVVLAIRLTTPSSRILMESPTAGSSMETRRPMSSDARRYCILIPTPSMEMSTTRQSRHPELHPRPRCDKTRSSRPYAELLVCGSPSCTSSRQSVIATPRQRPVTGRATSGKRGSASQDCPPLFRRCQRWVLPSHRGGTTLQPIHEPMGCIAGPRRVGRVRSSPGHRASSGPCSELRARCRATGRSSASHGVGCHEPGNQSGFPSLGCGS